MTAGDNLVISGGPPGHDFAETSAVVAAHLAGEGIASVVVDDPDAAFERLRAEPGRWTMVTVNALRWRMDADRYRPARAEWAYSIDPGHDEALDRHVRAGGGLLALHTAVICFDDSPRWPALVGGTWNWDRSSHPPLGDIDVSITAAGTRHPVTRGCADFTVTDEAYRFLDRTPDLVPLAVTRLDGVDHPLVWAREVDDGRVVTDLLGHGPDSLTHPAHAAILRAAARWMTR